MPKSGENPLASRRKIFDLCPKRWILLPTKRKKKTEITNTLHECGILSRSHNFCQAKCRAFSAVCFSLLINLFTIDANKISSHEKSRTFTFHSSVRRD